MKIKIKFISIILFLSLVLSLFCGCGQDPINYKQNLSDYVKNMDYHDDFTILQITDLHWDSGSQLGKGDLGAAQYLDKIISLTLEHSGHIDLIEFTGDTFMLSTKRTVKTFIDFITEKQIPYCMVWGNHDREGTYNPNWLSHQFLNAPYCLYTEIENDNLHGRSNYVINLVNDHDVAWQIFQLDSGASYREGAKDISLTYDYIRPEQLDWLSAEHTLVGDKIPALCYYHIAQAEVEEAYESISNGDPTYKSAFFKLEDFCISSYASSTLECFLKNNVKAAFSGHAHGCDWTCTFPEGITYGFGVKTGPELYSLDVPEGYVGAGFEVEDSFPLIGASLVTLKDSEGNFILEHVYYHERDEGNFVKWVKY